jgi:N-acetylglucosaminyldiphosphoundecaprenol N-acetyl-beta-D-mannosaminyltransferase
MTHSEPVSSRQSVLGLPVDTVSRTQAAQIIFNWAARRESRTVCLCNTDSLVRGMRDEQHAQSLSSADLVLPDGAPVAWAAGQVMGRKQPRVPGPDLMWDCCAKAADMRAPVFLYGGTKTTLDRLQQRLRDAYPKIEIVGAISPPFRPLSDEEDQSIINQINASGAGLLWVGLGCPKQEAWLRDHRGRVQAVMLGVGARLRLPRRYGQARAGVDAASWARMALQAGAGSAPPRPAIPGGKQPFPDGGCDARRLPTTSDAQVG